MNESGSYYDRELTTHLDGSKIFHTKEDLVNQRNVADILARAWACEIRPFGALTPVDWFAERHGRLIGIIEVKSRSHDYQKYPTVFLNFRKWISLTLASYGMGCPGLFVVHLLDGIFWAPLSQIDASNNSIGGCVRIVKAANDIEPVIEVPMSLFRKVDERCS